METPSSGWGGILNLYSIKQRRGTIQTRLLCLYHPNQSSTLPQIGAAQPEPMVCSEKQKVSQHVNKAKKTIRPRPRKHVTTSQRQLTRLKNSGQASSLWNHEKIQWHNLTAQKKFQTSLVATTIKLEG